MKSPNKPEKNLDHNCSLDSLPLRGKPTRDFSWQDNELFTVFQPIIGSPPSALYCHLTRLACGPSLQFTLRRLASETGRSCKTVSRNLSVLRHVGMVRLRTGRINQETECYLVDLKELARSLGAVYDSRTASLVLGPAAREVLKNQVALAYRKIYPLGPGPRASSFHIM